jgi:hypothetical protein
MDDYLRYLASVLAGDQREREQAMQIAAAGPADQVPGHTSSGRRGGKGRPAARAEPRMVKVGDLRLVKDVDDRTLRLRCGLLAIAQKRGEVEARERLEDSLAFCQAMGTLLDYSRMHGTEGQVMWRLTLTHPDTQRSDPTQGLLRLARPADPQPDHEG